MTKLYSSVIQIPNYTFQDKFTINPKTGLIKTSKGLDFEQAKSHMLIIGTEEGRAGGKGAFINDVTERVWLFIELGRKTKSR